MVAEAPPELLLLDVLSPAPLLEDGAPLDDDGWCEFAEELRCAIDGLLEPQAASASGSAIGSVSFLALEKVGMRQ
jgi:hypothetical protein